jgi:3-isopropylmalate/(R)-2-methylmalate dehydratase large subunit
VSRHWAHPNVDELDDPAERRSLLSALEYMGLRLGQADGRPAGGYRLHRLLHQRPHRRSARGGQVVQGRRVAGSVQALVVPGSKAVKTQAEAEGLDRIFSRGGL